jgi:hypothetical protein
MRFVWLFAALAACSFPEKHRATGDGGGDIDANAGGDGSAAIDGPPSDTPTTGPFRCMGHPFPTTSVKPLITLSGMVASPIGGGNKPNVPVVGVRDPSAQQFFATNTDPNGAFSAGAPIGNTPLDGHYDVGTAAQGMTYFYPPRPFDDDFSVGLSLMSPSEIQQLYSLFGVAFDPQRGSMFIQIVDCDYKPVMGASLTISPAGSVYYLINGTPSQTAASTDASGAVIVMNQPAGIVMISAKNSVGDFHKYQIPVRAGAVLTQMALQP